MIFNRKASKGDVIIWRAPGQPATGRDYGSALAQLVSAAGYAPQMFDYFDAPPDRAALACKRHLLTGGEVAVSDPSDANAAALGRIRQVYERAMEGRNRLAGVCLGSQQIAALHAGAHVVAGSASGFHIGFAAMQAEAPRFPSLTAFRFHYEAVLPGFLEAAQVSRLYASPGTTVEGYRIGKHITAVQFHLEFDPEFGQAVLNSNSQLMNRFGLDPQVASQRSDELAARWSEEAAIRLMRLMLA